MRIGIISDTHDQVARTATAVALLVAEGAEALVHCGDLTVPEVVHECARLPSYYVFGNNDFDEDDLRRAMAETGGVCLGRGGMVALGGRRVAVTHGDRDAEVRRLIRLGPDYLLVRTLAPPGRRARRRDCGGSTRGPCTARRRGRSHCSTSTAMCCVSSASGAVGDEGRRMARAAFRPGRVAGSSV